MYVVVARARRKIRTVLSISCNHLSRLYKERRRGALYTCHTENSQTDCAERASPSLLTIILHVHVELRHVVRVWDKSVENVRKKRVSGLLQPARAAGTHRSRVRHTRWTPPGVPNQLE